MSEIIQTSSHPCPGCGSRYRRDDKCNICGTTLAPAPPNAGPIAGGLFSHGFHREGRIPKGALWDKAQHKVKWR